MEKDYSLLRPFDLDKAKAGEAICSEAGTPLTFIGMSTRGRVVTEMPSTTICNDLQQHISMAPLAWVEGKPVYKGDRPYIKVPMAADMLEVEGVKDGLLFGGAFHIHPDGLTWTPPKKTREVKYYCYSDGHKLMWIHDCAIHPDWKEHPELDRTVTVGE